MELSGSKWSPKFFSLLVAIFIWYLAKQGGELTEGMRITVPLFFQDLPQSLLITSDPPTRINILAKAKFRYRRAFNASEIQAILNLKDALPGSFQYVLTQENFITPKGVSVVSINPSQIHLTIDEVIEKELKIDPAYKGNLKEGYLLKSLGVTPSYAKLKGPKSILEKLDSIPTKQVDLNNLAWSTDMMVRLDLPNKSIQQIDKIEFYTIHVTVQSTPLKKRFDNVPIYFQNRVYVTEMNPSTLHLYLKGPRDIINELDPSQLHGIIDLNYFSPGTYRIHPKAVVPKEITILEQWPIVSVWVKSKKISQIEEKTKGIE